MAEPRFSVVIPLYNKEPYIKDCLDSIMSQTFSDFEVVIVDDGSTDNSVDLVKRLYPSDKVRIIQKINGGPSSARNKGVQEAKGEWIVFLDADDLFLPNALENFNKLIIENGNIDFFVCNYYIAINNVARLFTNKRNDGLVKNPFYLEAKRELTDRPGSSVIKRELLISYPFNEKLRRYEDAECQYDMMRSNLIYQCSIPVMISVRDAGSASLFRKDINEDFVGHLVFEGKSYWEQVTLYLLALECKEGYPDKADSLYGKIYRRLDLKVVYLLLRLYWRFNSGINRILGKKTVTVSSLMQQE